MVAVFHVVHDCAVVVGFGGEAYGRPEGAAPANDAAASVRGITVDGGVGIVCSATVEGVDVKLLFSIIGATSPCHAGLDIGAGLVDEIAADGGVTFQGAHRVLHSEY